jgi:hypothetical protein
MSSSLSVRRPNTNLSAVNRPEMGAFRDNNFSFPRGALDWQAAQDNNSLSIIANQFTMAPTEGNRDVMWDQGTLLFVKKDNNIAKSFYDITSFRAGAATSAAAAYVNKGKTVSTNNIDRRNKNLMMSTLDSIAENFEPAGVCIGPTDPGIMQSVTDDQSTVVYSGNLKTVGVVTMGHTHFPNLFSSEELRAGHQLYFFIKCVPAPQKYVDVAGRETSLNSRVTLVPDLVFFSRKDDKLPERQSTEALRILKECKGDQPPLDDFSYIEWVYGTDTDPKQSTYPTHGFLRQALLYKLGTCLHYYRASNDRLPGQKKEALQYVTDYRTFPMIEIMLNIERIHGSA